MKEVIGQEHALGVLHAAMRGRMHHAWIFHGPVGVGKRTAAVAVARTLLCHDPATTPTGGAEPCGACPSCRLFANPQAAHPDLHVITKELAQYSDDADMRKRKLISIPVEVIREHLLAPAYRSSSLNHGKLFILDEAELLNDAGQNALLKTLEEPPAGTFIILVTSKLHELIPTIHSRCQRVGFVRLSDDALTRWLAERPEAAGVDARRRIDVARFAQGSPGQALLAIGYELDEWARAIPPLAERAAAGEAASEFGPAMTERCEAFAKAWVDNKDNKGASKEAANKRSVRLMFALLAELCRSKLREISARGLAGDGADAAMGPWLAAVELIDDAERELEANVSPPLLLDNLAIQWSQAGATAPA